MDRYPYKQTEHLEENTLEETPIQNIQKSPTTPLENRPNRQIANPATPANLPPRSGKPILVVTVLEFRGFFPVFHCSSLSSFPFSLSGSLALWLSGSRALFLALRPTTHPDEKKGIGLCFSKRNRFLKPSGARAEQSKHAQPRVFSFFLWTVKHQFFQLHQPKT
jgi:hypothetical protein